jgi:SsrA-binding protein
VPLALYWQRGLAKVTLGVCRGKKLYDKRASIKKRDADRARARGRDE